MMQVRVGKLVGEQTEARNVARPAPARRLQRQDRDLERIAGPGAVDKDGPGHRVDEGEIELLQGLRRRGLRELPGRSVPGLELHGLAGRDREPRWELVVPAVMDMLPVNRVLGMAVHEWTPRPRPGGRRRSRDWCRRCAWPSGSPG